MRRERRKGGKEEHTSPYSKHVDKHIMSFSWPQKEVVHINSLVYDQLSQPKLIITVIRLTTNTTHVFIIL